MSSEIAIRTESDDGPSDAKGPDVVVTSNPFKLAKSWLGYIKTRQFWLVLVFGYHIAAVRRDKSDDEQADSIVVYY